MSKLKAIGEGYHLGEIVIHKETGFECAVVGDVIDNHFDIRLLPVRAIDNVGVGCGMGLRVNSIEELVQLTTKRNY